MSEKMEETLKRFGEQFSWTPIVENPRKLGSHQRYIVAGMGGSHLGAWLIKKYGSLRELTIHRDYGLPPEHDEYLRDALFIGSSYSGTTEETIDAVKMARDRGLASAAISMGGGLLDMARQFEMPFITIPDTGLEPRMAIGYQMLALSRMMGDSSLENAIREAGRKTNPMEGQLEGARLAETLQGKIPLIWASNKNLPIAYIWKVKFNETSKIPAFCNAVPEACHNELTGFDVIDSTRSVSAQMQVIMLQDEMDHPRVQKRMQIAAEMFAERGIAVSSVKLRGEGFAKSFQGALLADWVSLGLAKDYGVANPQTPMVAEFKRRIA